ncbi:MAG: HD domain-containing protein [Patescibacteria group bacterium]|nr:HD domain-containing protein [Patescibacteria group bacterium]
MKKINFLGNQVINTIHFLIEVFSLKYVLRSSYQTLSRGLGQETIAEHSFMCAIIGYVLANLEHADVNKVVLMCLLHDIAETRTGDANFIHKHYQLLLEDKAITDMTSVLPPNMQKQIRGIYKELAEQKTKESHLVKEADILEQEFQEKHYFEIGNKQAKGWMDYSVKQLKNPTAVKIGRKLKEAKISGWWDNLLSKTPVSQNKFKTVIKYILNDNLKKRLR